MEVCFICTTIIKQVSLRETVQLTKKEMEAKCRLLPVFGEISTCAWEILGDCKYWTETTWIHKIMSINSKYAKLKTGVTCELIICSIFHASFMKPSSTVAETFNPLFASFVIVIVGTAHTTVIFITVDVTWGAGNIRPEPSLWMAANNCLHFNTPVWLSTFLSALSQFFPEGCWCYNSRFLFLPSFANRGVTSGFYHWNWWQFFKGRRRWWGCRGVKTNRISTIQSWHKLILEDIICHYARVVWVDSTFSKPTSQITNCCWLIPCQVNTVS